MSAELLIGYLSNLTYLSPAFKEVLKAGLYEEHYKSRQILHGAGQVENRLWYLNTGLGRSYIYDDHERSHTLRFWNPGDVIFSYAGFLKQPSYEYIELLAESDLYAFSYENIDILMNDFSEIKKLAGHLSKIYQQNEHKRNYLHSLHTEERYSLFRKENAVIFQTVPLGIIASYLHMSRENLSRIISKD
jgi:CRP-like cAMP-binding protein